MDLGNRFREIISASISLVKPQDQEVVKSVLDKTHNLLLCLDSEKSMDYKMALIMEYLEGIAPLLPAQNALECYEFVKRLPDKRMQEQAHAQIAQVLREFADPTELNPPLVVFWLQRSCDLRDLKNMHALMIFLTKEEQQQVLKMDKKLWENPRFKLLIQCLPTH